MKLMGKVALITGGGRGIGRAIAEQFAAEGATVAVVSRMRSALEETVEVIRASGGKAAAFVADVTDENAIRAAVQSAEAALGPIDILVNNAGRFEAIGPVWEVDPAQWWLDVQTNVLGVFHGTRAVVPGMIARKCGWIINITGGGSNHAFPYGTGYGASKAAIVRFTESVAAEVKASGICVFGLAPGLVRTALGERQCTADVARKYLPDVGRAFAAGQDYPPTAGAAMAVELASGRFDLLTGRAFYVWDDLDEIERKIPRILQEDLKVLRIRTEI